MTPFDKVYDAFLSKISDDEWIGWEEEERNIDMRALLEGAIPFFKFPRISLERDENGFKEAISQDEIQILATYMKCEWLDRALLTWDTIKPQYHERDFSQANLIAKLEKLLSSERANGALLEANYYRAPDKRVFPYRKLAGRKSNGR